jgi:hypothetical protein
MARQRTFVDQPYDIGARQAEQIGGLLRRQFRIRGDDVHRDSRRQIAKQRANRPARIIGKDDRLLAHPDAHRGRPRAERRDNGAVAVVQIEHLGPRDSHEPSITRKRHKRNHVQRRAELLHAGIPCTLPQRRTRGSILRKSAALGKIARRDPIAAARLTA